MSETVYYYNTGGKQVTNPRWWTLSEASDVGGSVVAGARAIMARQSSRRRLANLFAQLYSNQRLSSVYELGTTKNQAAVFTDPYGLGTRGTYNVVQVVVDTAAAKIAKNRTRVRLLTTDGNWRQARQAKQLTRFVDGLFDAAGVYPQGQEMFIDGCVFEGGLLKVYSLPDGTICADRVLPIEVLVDDLEGMYGRPRNLYHRQLTHRDVARSRCDRKTQKGREAYARLADVPGEDPISGKLSGDSDMVALVEAWHLPTYDEAGDGRRAVAFDGGLVEVGDWKREYFPFTKFSWNSRRVGWWGQPLAEIVLPIQLQLNHFLEKERIAIDHMCVPRWLLPIGSGVSLDAINDDPRGSILEYNSDKPPPQPFTANAMPPQFYERLDKLKSEAFELAGISQLSASAVKPAGLNAAVALQEYRDAEEQRLVIPGQRFEEAHVQLAKLMINEARWLYHEKGLKDLKARAPGSKFIEEIKWSDVDLREDQYTIQRFPSALLPNSVAGRLQRVEDLIQGGWIDREEGLRLLDAPDLERIVSPRLASLEAIRRQIDLILEDGDYSSPEAYLEPSRALAVAQGEFLTAQAQGAPEDRLDLLDRWIQELDEKVQRMAAEAQPQQPQPMASQQQVSPEQAAAEQAGMVPQLMGGTPALPSFTPA
jgi:hypothetical protein